MLSEDLIQGRFVDDPKTAVTVGVSAVIFLPESSAQLITATPLAVDPSGHTEGDN